MIKCVNVPKFLEKKVYMGESMGKRIKEDCYIKVIKTIQKYKLLNEGDKLVVGVSGGPDSMCLLDIFTRIKQQGHQKGISPLAIDFDFVVAHINHMIREEAKEDEAYVKKYCDKNHILFFAKSIDVQKLANTNKISTEEAGREARYAFFEEVLQKVDGNKVAIAHNKNDKVETIIMNELRGCGIQGLKGIEPLRGKYIRPLIDCERQEIEAYCDEHNLQPRIDKTNFENVYTRNKIRNIVIPYIKEEFNPNIIETMDRLSKLVIEQEEYIQKQVGNIYKEILLEEKLSMHSIKENKNINKKENKIENENVLNKDTEMYILLDLKGLNKQEKVIKSNIILYTITRLFGTSKGIERIHIEDIIKLCSNNIGNKFLMPNKNLKVFVKNGKVKFSKEM